MKKILIANRGEIAVRVIRTCRDLGLRTAAVYSTCDRTALHVRLADEAYHIGPDAPAESYLCIDAVIRAALSAGADAVHPGYGFLAENPAFAEGCEAAGLVFIGPAPAVMRRMGSKTGARRVAMSAGVQVVPGTERGLSSEAAEAELLAAAGAVGYPLVVKADAGGGGKGMRIVRNAADLTGAVAMARSEARTAFGDPTLLFERLVEGPRHVEVQLLGDRHGTVVPFVERECSIQRRHQKLIEETPSPSVTPALRRELAAAAAAMGRAVGYTSAGTMEFLLDRAGRFYFLEMNTRLQVEHPVTEAVTGVDFVKAQIEIAGGTRLQVSDSWRGHAIECRIYAEDPERGFLPSPGRIAHLRAPAGPGIRDDSGAAAGSLVPIHYDALVSKVVAWAPDRAGAIARMRRALTEYDLRGVETTIAFCGWVVGTPEFAEGRFDTASMDGFLDRFRQDRLGQPALEELAVMAAALHAREGRAGREPIPPQSAWARRARSEGVES